jgi:hypothetical protein
MEGLYNYFAVMAMTERSTGIVRRGEDDLVLNLMTVAGSFVDWHAHN